MLAGKEYGSGSSRDWAAKGPALLGVRFVLAESFERIHRQNLVGMGVLPLQFKTGESAETHRLTGQETYSVLGLEIGIALGQDATVQVEREDGTTDRIAVTVRIDQAAEVGIFGHGGILRWSCARRSRAPDDAGAQPERTPNSIAIARCARWITRNASRSAGRDTGPSARDRRGRPVRRPPRPAPPGGAVGPPEEAERVLELPTVASSSTSPAAARRRPTVPRSEVMPRPTVTARAIPVTIRTPRCFTSTVIACGPPRGTAIRSNIFNGGCFVQSPMGEMGSERRMARRLGQDRVQGWLRVQRPGDPSVVEHDRRLEAPAGPDVLHPSAERGRPVRERPAERLLRRHHPAVAARDPAASRSVVTASASDAKYRSTSTASAPDGRS